MRCFAKIWITVLLSISCAAPASAQDDDELPKETLKVSVKRVGSGEHRFFEVRANAEVRASPERVWQVMTGYDRLHEFVPNLESSRLVERNGNQVVLEQKGAAGFLFFRQPIRLLVRVTEQPISSLDVSLIEGDMRHYEGHWKISPSGPTGTHLEYAGELEPSFFVPPLISNSLIQSDVKKMMKATVHEIEQGPGSTDSQKQ